MNRIIDSVSKWSLTTVVILLLLLFVAACHKTPPANITAPHAMQTVVLNDITVLSFEDCPFTFRASSIFADINDYPERMAMMPNGEFKTLVKTYLVKTDGRVALVDGGMGTESGVHGKTREYLIMNGIQPSDVTDILLTHIDVDHIAGLIHQGQAVYPAATLRLARVEYDAWIIRGAGRGPESVALARQMAAAYDGRITLFEYEDTVIHGIVAHEAGGHTAGHTIYDITSGDRKLTIVGDMLHVAPVQLRYTDYCTIYDMDPARAGKTRERILAWLSGENRLVAGMHFPEIGKVRRAPCGGYTIVPE